MDTLSDSISKLAKVTALAHCSELQRAASAGEDLVVVTAKIEDDRLISASCFIADEVEFFNTTYYAEFQRLSSAAAEDAIARSKAYIDSTAAEPSKPDRRKVDRLAVRQLVVRNGEEIQAFAKMGGNVFQLSLDQQDAVDAKIEHLSDDDKLAFLNVYTEELNALTGQMKHNALQLNDSTSKVNEQIAADNESAAAWGKLVGAFVIIGLVIFLIYKK